MADPAVTGPTSESGMPPGASRSPSGPSCAPALPRDAVYLVEWWVEGERPLDHDGGWVEVASAGAARERALVAVARAWSGRVRITILEGGATLAAVDAASTDLERWDVGQAVLPGASPGPRLPPRSAGEIRDEVVCGCRDALGLAMRAGLLRRERVADLLHGIDRSFDTGLAEEEKA